MGWGLEKRGREEGEEGKGGGRRGGGRWEKMGREEGEDGWEKEKRGREVGEEGEGDGREEYPVRRLIDRIKNNGVI